jgi:hypothetical protein
MTAVVFWLCLSILLLWSATAAKPPPQKKAINPEDFNTFGTLLLDAVVWDKAIPNNNAHTLVMVSNKAYIGKQTTDNTRSAFLKMAQGLEHKEVLCAQIIVNGADNHMLATRLGVPNPGRMPYPYFFIIKKGESESIALQTSATVADITLTDVLRSLTKHTGVRLPMEGTSSELDSMTIRFISPTATSAERLAIVTEAEAFVQDLRTQGASGSAVSAALVKKADGLSWYPKYMQKALEKGSEATSIGDFARGEKARLQTILESDKVSDDRKKEFRWRVNIISSFCTEEPEVPAPASVQVNGDGDGEVEVRGADGRPLE